MAVSVFKLFSIGIGPSSSHTMGPMRAARRFLKDLESEGKFEAIERIQIDLYGSLALTGVGHGTDKALVLGLEGNQPDKVDPSDVDEKMQSIRDHQTISLLGKKQIPFILDEGIRFLKDKRLPKHSNAMKCMVWDGKNKKISEKIYYSIGGGFIMEHSEIAPQAAQEERETLPHPFNRGDELLEICTKENISIAEVMLRNERTRKTDEEIEKGLAEIWSVMKNSIERGCKTEGILPGGLNVRRRAPGLNRHLSSEDHQPDPASVMDWVSLWAMAVNEENAAGGRIVTAPTNGAAGIIPAVIQYFLTFTKHQSQKDIETFLLTAAAIGHLYKEGASLAAAEMGCQGEVGVACSMAAGGLAAVMGGSPFVVQDAAEIGMEHNLGLTCDPVAGLVQIPCIERNAMGGIKAINAARLAIRGQGGDNLVTLDQVIRTMNQIGCEMSSIFKETSQGGLAVNVPEC